MTAAAGIPPGRMTPAGATTTWLVLAGVSVCHGINDIMQSLVTAIYPLLRAEFALEYWQIGFLSFAFMVTASVLQPVVGALTDRRPMPMILPLGMACTLLGVILLGEAPAYALLVLGAMAVGLGSAVFHPEGSRVARAASGGRYGTAQSLFQMGGNFGHMAGPLLAAFVVAPWGRGSVAWFALGAGLGILILWRVALWHRAHRAAQAARPRVERPGHGLPRRRVGWALVVLAVLVFTKNIYTATFGSFWALHVIERFDLTLQQSQLMLFAFMAGGTLGVLAGGPIGDRIGPLGVIWVSILGTLPFSILLPHAGLWQSAVLTVIVGFVISSAFPAIVVFAQELVPGRVGMINGVFFGLAFGMGGIAAAGMGLLADAKGLDFVFRIVAWLPALGLLTVFLPRGVVRGQG
ncbi:Arabinose efflux permease [Rubellimicrobium thermophilum DSM 16684]|uniref:Arabinose efflux permease n=1 Tax=Rubellimicrobium thermophilum DSM 16684 TaxID=1123069 RepID=S9QSZ0_9RHOB|nr:MFS transporter [Rubellimicrobium thermophilum]EPX82722.1 Arabinose efflux permease [Rubellimicrobium thermophilum DSM 16684]